jgi:hypothetical protein
MMVDNFNMTFQQLRHILFRVKQSIHRIHKIPYIDVVFSKKGFKVVDGLGEGQSFEDMPLFEVCFERYLYASVVSIPLDDGDQPMDHLCL